MNLSNDLVTPLGQLEAVCENATVALFVMDERQHCVYMNRAAEAMTGYTLAEVQGGPLHNYVHHTHADGTPFPIDECPIDRAAPQNNHEQGEELFVHKDGHFYPVAFTASPIRNGKRVIGTVIEVRDISEDKRRETADRATRELAEVMLREVRLEAIVQAVTDTATRITGAQFGAFFYNVTDAAGDRLTLYALSGVGHEHFSQFPMPRATPLFGPTFEGAGTVLIGDVLRDSRYGRWGPHGGMPAGHLPVRSYLAVAVKSDNGEVLGGLFFGHGEPDVFSARDAGFAEACAAQAAIGVSRAHLFKALEDARERAEAEAREKQELYAEATRANEMKDLFLATVSHELRTPLTSILGWSDMLVSGRLPPSMVDNAVLTISRSARAQAQIVEDLLDISRIVSGKLQLHPRCISIERVIEAAMEAIQPAAFAKGIALELVVAEDVGEITADPDRMQQVVWNLLANAVKFTDRGRVSIGVARQGDWVEISVRDTGRGIESQFLPYLFERFTQRDSTSTREHGGLGLGLAIVRQVVETHGGTVSAVSNGLGQGACFTVRLPVGRSMPLEGGERGPADRDARGSAEMTDALPRLDGCDVLLVEDDPDSRRMLQIVLEMQGARVHACESAAAALKVASTEPVNLVVSDIGMPGTDGYAFIRMLRIQESHAGRPPAPAVALTAYAQNSDRERALDAGFQRHVAKPVHPAELLAVVSELRTAALV
ncbi:PAS domain-containing hybrid sensor histidine kinase/response regulator [Cognatilysobacter bugurensis]|uniref:histidine kinase n=1 Tax=Cognatilysobacter bugurensis TaxID=543356 RepID=A0A918SWG0_9GAMM|nr:ATP-binding protein [Lysobacter bugurensis]GHA73772.1 two-component hybrid sensor and regulator [Lysobacter bugurensis]